MSEERGRNRPDTSITDIESALGTEIFENRENERAHGKYSEELRFFNLVKNGDTEKLKEAIKQHTKENIGRMSRNPLRQQMYAFVAAATLATRFAIEGGLGEEDAYHLSDIYIQKADACLSSEEIWTLEGQMSLAFAEKVRQARQQPAVSAPVLLVIDYIFNHLHGRITLGELAEQAGFSSTYLSFLFKAETGDTITEFIQKKRISEAESLLRYSEFTPSEISQYLGFCSQSHFTSTFKKYTGMTPAQFRKTYFHRKW